MQNNDLGANQQLGYNKDHDVKNLKFDLSNVIAKLPNEFDNSLTDDKIQDDATVEGIFMLALEINMQKSV